MKDDTTPRLPDAEECEDLLAVVAEEAVALVGWLNGSFPAVAELLGGVDARLPGFVHDSLDFANRRMVALQYLCGDEFFRHDAQIVQRTHLECLTRVVYVVTREKDEIGAVLTELYDDLYELQFLRSSVNVRPLLDSVERLGDGGQARDLWSGARMPQDEEEALRRRMGKRERNRLTQKYSFSEMAKRISDAPARALPYTRFLHGYNQASHVAHADLLAYALVADYEARDEVPRRLLDFSHRAAILSDAVHLLLLVCRQLYGLVDLPFATEAAMPRLETMSAAVHRLQAAFHSTQRHLYEGDGPVAG